jgi:type IV secretion system protein VirB4
MIETLTWVIAGFGIALVVILLSLIAKANKDRKLSKHRSKEASVADLLNYAAEVDACQGKSGDFVILTYLEPST